MSFDRARFLFRYAHQSSVLGCEMKFNVYLPPATSEKLPVLYFLSGLTCTEDNFMVSRNLEMQPRTWMTDLSCSTGEGGGSTRCVKNWFSHSLSGYVSERPGHCWRKRFMGSWNGCWLLCECHFPALEGI